MLQVGRLLGHGGRALADMERQHGTFVQVEGERGDPWRPLLIHGKGSGKADTVAAIRRFLLGEAATRDDYKPEEKAPCDVKSEGEGRDVKEGPVARGWGTSRESRSDGVEDMAGLALLTIAQPDYGEEIYYSDEDDSVVKEEEAVTDQDHQRRVGQLKAEAEVIHRRKEELEAVVRELKEELRQVTEGRDMAARVAAQVRGSREVAEVRKSREWVCSLCTFSNLLSGGRCAMCGNPRQG